MVTRSILKWRVLIVSIVLSGSMFCSDGLGQAVGRCRDNPAMLQLLAAYSEFREFEQRQKEWKRQRQVELLRIPAYNMELSKAVVEFHRHISDLHYRHVSCKLCRQHVKKIKELAKKIDQGMR